MPAPRREPLPWPRDRLIAGVDEAGRGPLAGPVVAAACILPHGVVWPGLDDSKKLSSVKREQLFAQLSGDPRVLWGVGVIDARQIDRLNILQATLEAMRSAVAALSRCPDLALIDGQHCPDRLPCPTQAIVKGDALYPCISAASVLAKVYRDGIMERFHQQWPAYRFDLHKGYGTKLHLEKIAQFGPSPVHRRSFAPFKKQAS